MIIVLALLRNRLPIGLKLVECVQRVLNLGDFVLAEPLIQQFFDLPLFLLHLCDVVLNLSFIESLLENVRTVTIFVVFNPLVLLFQVFNAHLFVDIVTESLPR